MAQNLWNEEKTRSLSQSPKNSMRLFRRSSSPHELSDEELVFRYQADENPAWMGELFDRYTHLVFLVSMKYLKDEMESEDMSMRIFEKLMKDLKKYEVKAFRPWLHTVVKNQCLVYLDQQKRLRKRADQYEQEVKAEPQAEALPLNGHTHAHEREAQLLLMEQAMHLLKDEQRVCLDLFYLQQKSYQEVADTTGFTLKQVKSYIQNGKRMLRKHMEESRS